MHWKYRRRKDCLKLSLFCLLPSYSVHPVIHTLVLYDFSQVATKCRLRRLPWNLFSSQLLGCRECHSGQRLAPLGKYRHSRLVLQCPEQSLLLLCSPFTFPTWGPHSLVMQYSAVLSVQYVLSSLLLILCKNSSRFLVLLMGCPLWCSAPPPGLAYDLD